MAAERCIWYQDETKDWITIADDDDLHVAYDTASQHFDGNLKIYVKPVVKKEEQCEQPVKGIQQTVSVAYIVDDKPK